MTQPRRTILQRHTEWMNERQAVVWSLCKPQSNDRQTCHNNTAKADGDPTSTDQAAATATKESKTTPTSRFLKLATTQLRVHRMDEAAR